MDEDAKSGSMPRSQLPAALRISPDKHRRWRKEGLLRDADPAHRHDATEFALLERMVNIAGPRRAKRAWRVIQPMLESRRPAASGTGWVVVDRNLERDSVAFSAGELARCFREEGLFWVIPLSPLVGEAERAFGKHVRGTHE